MKVATDQFLNLVAKSGLVERERLLKALEELDARCGRDALEDPKAISDHLIDSGLITPWQADKMLEGRHRGFFLGNYKLLAHLGTGGMSSVYLAEHKHMHQLRAVKVLPQHRVNDSSYLARFYQEARAVAALDHPNIVRAYDVDTDGNVHYLVMEYVEGRDLQQMVAQDGPLAYDVAADYIRQAANGLEHAHNRGLIHRDIKPANVLVDPREVVKVLDMGLALFNQEQQDASLTVAHDENVLGTADYLSPEQAINSHTVDHRTDLYSLGCTLYYVLTGRQPFPDGSLVERLMKHRLEQPQSIRAFRPDAPQALVEICQRMMAKRPEERYASASQVADILTGWLTSVGSPRANPSHIGRFGQHDAPPNRSSGSPIIRLGTRRDSRSSSDVSRKSPSAALSDTGPNTIDPTIKSRSVVPPLTDGSLAAGDSKTGAADSKARKLPVAKLLDEATAQPLPAAAPVVPIPSQPASAKSPLSRAVLPPAKPSSDSDLKLVSEPASAAAAPHTPAPLKPSAAAPAASATAPKRTAAPVGSAQPSASAQPKPAPMKLDLSDVKPLPDLARVQLPQEHTVQELPPLDMLRPDSGEGGMNGFTIAIIALGAVGVVAIGLVLLLL